MTLAFGELVTDAVIGFTGTGDLLNNDDDSGGSGAPLLNDDDVDAVLNAGLAADVPNTDALPVVGAGVLITTDDDDETPVLVKTGLRLQLLFNIGVSLLFVARIGDDDNSCCVVCSIACSEPFCSFISSSELLFVT